MIHPADGAKSHNPRLQCAVCGKWKRLRLRDGNQSFYGGCSATEGDHNAGGRDQDVCDVCCRAKCKGRFS